MKKEDLKELKVIVSDGKTSFGTLQRQDDGSSIITGIGCSSKRAGDITDDRIFKDIRMWFMKANLNDLEIIELSSQYSCQAFSLTEKEQHYWLRCFDEMQYIKKNCMPILENGLFESKQMSVWDIGKENSMGRIS